jgi:hypothetical protein
MSEQKKDREVLDLLDSLGFKRCRCTICNCVLLGGFNPQHVQDIIPRCPDHAETEPTDVPGMLIIPMQKDRIAS